MRKGGRGRGGCRHDVQVESFPGPVGKCRPSSSRSGCRGGRPLPLEGRFGEISSSGGIGSWVGLERIEVQSQSLEERRGTKPEGREADETEQGRWAGQD